MTVPYHVEIAPESGGYGDPADWIDITDDVRHGGIAIQYGRSGEGQKSQTSQALFTLDNTSGNYSPDNPMGAYYPTLSRNTECRIWVEQDESYLDLNETVYARAEVADHASLDITGDIDVAIDMQPSQWGTAEWLTSLVSKLQDSTSQKSWVLYIGSGGNLIFLHSSNGTNIFPVACTEPVPFVAGQRGAIRVTLDVDNGASGNTVTFYYADTIAGPWTQLGDAIISAGTTSIYASSAPIEIGCCWDSTFGQIRNKVYGVQIKNGIGGTAVLNADFTGVTPGSATYEDPNGRVVTPYLLTSFANRDDRAWGEITDLQPSADKSGNDRTAAVTVNGIMSRLEQGNSPVLSTLYRGETSATDLVQYWPVEDGEGSTQLVSATGGRPMRINGSPSLASFTGFDCSHPIMTLSTDTQCFGPIPVYTPGSTGSQMYFLLAVPSGGATDGQALIGINTTGSLSYWRLTYHTGGGLRLRAYADPNSSTATLDTGIVAFGVNGKLLRVSVQLMQSGGNVYYNVATLEVGASSGTAMNGTVTSQTVGRMSLLTVSPGAGLADVSMGHFSVHSETTSIFAVASELNAYAGEPALRRISRLCEENGIEYSGSTSITSTLMGPQRPANIMQLLRECEDAEDGILYEPRILRGIGFRDRRSMYALDALELEHVYLSDPVQPTYDDQNLVNDMTVTRDGGSSARYVLESGPMSVSQSDGVGRYDASATLNLYQDSQPQYHAQWKVHLGTVQGARFPNLRIDLLSSNMSVVASLIKALDIGDRVDITSPPQWASHNTIQLLVLGYNEEIDETAHIITLNCAPYSPWNIGMYGVARYQPDGSTLELDVTSSATSLSVLSPANGLWTTAPADLPITIVVNGERMTLTAVTGASSPQAFTVTRSVNGVVKAHSAGSVVEIAQPDYYGL